MRWLTSLSSRQFGRRLYPPCKGCPQMRTKAQVFFHLPQSARSMLFPWTVRTNQRMVVQHLDWGMLRTPPTGDF
jgi:hypothetical protein